MASQQHQPRGKGLSHYNVQSRGSFGLKLKMQAKHSGKIVVNTS